MISLVGLVTALECSNERLPRYSIQSHGPTRCVHITTVGSVRRLAQDRPCIVPQDPGHASPGSKSDVHFGEVFAITGFGDGQPFSLRRALHGRCHGKPLLREPLVSVCQTSVRSSKLVPIGGLNPRPCSLRARERESLAPIGPETTRSDRHPQLSPRSRERRTLATARQRGRFDPSRCKRHGPRHFGRGPLNSPSWTRTSNLAVNSRPLYRLSYRGS